MSRQNMITILIFFALLMFLLGLSIVVRERIVYRGRIQDRLHTAKGELVTSESERFDLRQNRSLNRLSREIARATPILGAHLDLASLEIRAGASLHQALFSFARRIKINEAAALATLLDQTEQLGTSVTDALRVYRDEMRDRRLVRAEQKAHALPAKLVLPLGLFVFPVILVVILLPAVIRMKSAGF